MLIRIGYDIALSCLHPTAFVTMLNVRPERTKDLLRPDILAIEPSVPVRHYVDGFGNVCTRFSVPAGTARLSTDTIISDSGELDDFAPEARQLAVEELPDEALVYMLPSRYCDVDLLGSFAWNHFGHTPLGWARVQAVVEFAHNHLQFSYPNARPTRTASEAMNEKIGVCRDFAHLAITLCRCLNIPARYCTGYLGDIGVPRDPAPMDFSAWFEVFLDGRWFTFDARHNRRRIGRIVMGYGRDAADVPIIQSYGPHILQRFDVVTDEIENDRDAEVLAPAMVGQQHSSHGFRPIQMG